MHLYMPSIGVPKYFKIILLVFVLFIIFKNYLSLLLLLIMLVNIITYFQGLRRYDACYLVLFCGTGLMAGLKNYRYDLRFYG